MLAAPALAQETDAHEFNRDGFSVSLTPLSHDQAASFYIARGLPRPETERYSRRCVLAATLRNQRPSGAISFRSGEWEARTRGTPARPVRTRAQWLEELEAAGVPEAARIAFEWAQVPDQHEFQPGDWIQGMLSVPVDRETAFDLKLRWRAEGRDHVHWLTGLRCP